MDELGFSCLKNHREHNEKFLLTLCHSEQTDLILVRFCGVTDTQGFYVRYEDNEQPCLEHEHVVCKS